ncbi:MAG: RNA polymerase sigma factor [Candidatus Phaeomarinobacter sp.]
MESVQDGPGAEAAADAAFAARVEAGEPNAMREAVDLFLPQVLATARRMLKNEADAEELAQETFLRVWKNIGTWTPKGARLRTWIVRIAMNLCYDRLRKKGYGKSMPIEDAPELIDDQPDAVEGIVRDDRAGQVTRAVDALPDRQRAAIQLVHFDEMTNIEAAKVMDVSIDALESLLARGRRGLKKALIDQKQELLGEVR